ncbi:hypothetical protein [uncultured Caulobacter sp.]|uniref:hypothetical protein n=1 Tax=uncultured Caulobacter sp. TaxID=158749 RepID=UPI00260AB10D|nr:hypothetical protein [uncultured Caulobacter sp.]
MPSAPPSRITLAQVLALLAIWAAALHGLARPTPSRDARAVAAKGPPSAPCARAFRQG